VTRRWAFVMSVVSGGGPISLSDTNEDLRLYSMLGDVDLVRHMINLLIQCGARHLIDDSEPVEGNTPLIEASRGGHTETVSQLDEAHPDPRGCAQRPRIDG
jgi:hypothetical protein